MDNQDLLKTKPKKKNLLSHQVVAGKLKTRAADCYEFKKIPVTFKPVLLNLTLECQCFSSHSSYL